MATTIIADAGVEMATSRDGGQLFVHRPGNYPTLWYTKRGRTVAHLTGTFRGRPLN
jgi:hypothetical protein